MEFTKHQNMVLDFFTANNRWPTASVCRPGKEKYIANLFWMNVNQNGAEYSDAFRKHCQRLGWVSRDQRVQWRKEEIIKFKVKKGRFPLKGHGAREHRLATFFHTYTCPTHSSFDADFLALAQNEYGWKRWEERAAASAAP